MTDRKLEAEVLRDEMRRLLLPAMCRECDVCHALTGERCKPSAAVLRCRCSQCRLTARTFAEGLTVCSGSQREAEWLRILGTLPEDAEDPS